MSELGLLLKKAREERGYSLEDMEEFTKIRKRYLEAIETGDFKALPGNFYVRAFIKTYAITVGLDPKEVLALYKSDLPPTILEEQVHSAQKKQFRTNFNFDRLSRWVSTLLMVCFVVFVIGIVYYFWYQNHGTNQNAVDTSNKVTNKAEPLPKPSNPSATPPPTSGKTGNSASSDSASSNQKNPQVKLVSKNNNFLQYNVLNTDKINLELDILQGDCWVEVSQIIEKQHHHLYTNTMKQSNSSTWKTSSLKSLYLNVGRPINMQITVNGIKLPVQQSLNPIQYEIDLVK